jgi:hypothetical protein
MKLYLSIIVGFLSITIGFTQERVIHISEIEKNINESFTIVDDATGEFYLFLKSNGNYSAFLYNSQYEQLGPPINQKELKRNKDDILGYTIEGKKISLLMYSETSKEFGSLIFDFNTNSSAGIEYDFKLGRELVVDSFVFENKTQLYTISKRDNELRVYIFDGVSETPVEKKIQFSDDQFLDRRDRPTKIYNILTEVTNGVVFVNGEFINTKVPNSIEKTSKTVKTYNFENQFIITSDRHDEFTYVIKLDLETLSAATLRVPQGELEGSRLGTKTNSYYQGGNLYQIAVNDEQLKLRMTDGKTGSLINEKSSTKFESIEYRNTPIYKAGKKTKSYTSSNKTEQFLKQMSDSDTGITVYEQDGVKQITFGAFEDSDSGNAIIIGAVLGGFTGALIGAAISGTSSSFISYNNTNAVRTIGLFDEWFNHLDGTVSENPFDRIQNYVKDKKKIKAPTVFSIGEAYFFGGFINDADMYDIVKFE